MSTVDSSINRSIYYVDKLYERVDWDYKVSEERTYAGKSVVIEQQDASAREVRYLHVDRLGSTDAVTDASGKEVLTDSHGYDSFGKPRGRDWQPSGDQMHPAGQLGTTTNHGFTSHEHLDETFLIHMNGRVYDYRLGCFLSVDPLISNPGSSQSINPYSYIGNNPLSGVDPTGYSCDDYSSARCDTIVFNAPEKDGKVAVRLKDNGKIVFEGRVSPDTKVNDLVPGFIGKLAPPASGSGGADQGESRNGGLPPDALALNMGQIRAVTVAGGGAAGAIAVLAGEFVCNLPCWVITGGIALAVLSGGDSPRPNIATDASGALKPGVERPLRPGEEMEAPAPAPQPAAGGAGGMSRGPGLPRNAGLAGLKHPETGVPFDLNGYPDFKAAGLVKAEVQIRQTGTRAGDFREANKTAGLYNTPEGYTWHHHQDGTTMQLVPRDIHAQTGHTGGFMPSIFK